MRIGTRSTAMAIAQTEEVAAQLQAAHKGLAAEIVRFSPRGDRDQISKLDRHGGKGGAFVEEIRHAMREGDLQAAMHSLKDMPGNEETPGLTIAAMMKREPVEDALALRPDQSIKDFLDSAAEGMKSALILCAALLICVGCFQRLKLFIIAALLIRASKNSMNVLCRKPPTVVRSVPLMQLFLHVAV